MRNRLKYWRHQLQVDNKKEFAGWLGKNYSSYVRWERQAVQPDLETLVDIWLKLKTKFPDILLQDLIEIDRPQ